MITFTEVIARNSIYIDFEGIGKSKNEGKPLPHMVGVLRPNPEKGRGGKYHAVFFRDFWTAPRNGAWGKASIAGFEETIEDLLDEAEEKGGVIVYWSDYEGVSIEANAPALLERFENLSLNLLPPLRTIKNRRRMQLDEEFSKELNKYLKAFYPSRNPIAEFDPGPAEACRRIDKFSMKHKRWRKLGDRQKQYLRDLLDYNDKDCRVTWSLALRLARIYDNKIK